MKTRFPRPKILENVCHDRHGVIEASAGTGKTYTIEHLVVDLLLRTEARLEEILVVTFTEKATAELRRRIRALIERVLSKSEPCESETSIATLERDHPGWWYLDSNRRRKLESELFAFDRSPIFTIHGFCNRVLRELAFSSGQMLNPQNVDADTVFIDAWREALRAKFTMEETYAGPLRRWIESGKTEDDLRRLLQSAHRQGYLKNRLDLGREIERHAGFLLASFDPQEYVADLARLTVQPKSIGMAEDSATDLMAILRSGEGPIALLDALNVDLLDALISPKTRYSKEPSLTFPSGLSPTHLRCREGLSALRRLCLLQRAEERSYADLFLPVVEDLLARHKERLGLFEYDDLLSRVHDALNGSNGAEMTATLQGRFRFGLIDEFQDTDARQWEIFQRIFVESEGGVIFVIGDPKQAIYGFRGADVQTYISAREALLTNEGQPAQYLSLEDNYRSTSSMINAVNHILESQSEGALLQGDIRYDAPVRCGRPELSLHVDDGDPVPPITLWAHKPKRRGSRRDLSGWALMDTFMTAVTDTLLGVISEAKTYCLRNDLDGSSRQLTAKDVFVLVRSRREAQLVSQALNAVGVPCVRQQESDPLRSEEALAVLDVLRAIAQPLSETSRMWAFATPFFDVGWTQLSSCRQLALESEYVIQLNAWREMADKGDYGRLFRSLRRESGLTARARFRVGGEELLTRLDQLFEWLLEVIGARRVTMAWLVNFLERATLGQVPDETPEIGSFRIADARDAVQVMTMHKSKGLEAPVVCLFGGFLKPWASPVNVVTSDGQRHVIVGQAAREAFKTEIDREIADEDERLLYVALTRAGAKLYLPFVASDLTVAGPYGRLNQRLRAMKQAGLPEDLFVIEDIDALRPTHGKASQVKIEDKFKVSDSCRDLLLNRDDRTDFDLLRRRHAPWVVTSYSAMKGLEKKEAEEVVKRESLPIDQQVEPAQKNNQEALPGGRFMGRFLHEAIEALDFDHILDLDLELWRSYPPVVEAFERTMRRHDIEPRWMRAAQTLIYQALSRRLPLSQSMDLPPLASLRGHREIEFIFPMPEQSHPLLGQLKDRRCTVERGLIKGFIDFTFQHEDKLYWLDWKSDVMTNYGPETLAAHVDQHYDLQAWLYTLSLVRLLGITNESVYEARFGGFLYVFLRGLTADAPSNDGLVYARPQWSDLVEFERSLIADPRLPRERNL